MKKSDETRRRLLEAATAEFSSLGVAGARVDRIAANAGCNKQAIYAYFGSKEDLYAAVYTAVVVETIESVPIDAHDLPGYAVRLFDFYAARPEVLRLTLWSMLEAPELTAKSRASRDATLRRIKAIRDAQAAGAVTRSITPGHLLDFVLRLSTASAREYPSEEQPGGDEPGAQPDREPVQALRRSLYDVVRRMVIP